MDALTMTAGIAASGAALTRLHNESSVSAAVAGNQVARVSAGPDTTNGAGLLPTAIGSGDDSQGPEPIAPMGEAPPVAAGQTPASHASEVA